MVPVPALLAVPIVMMMRGGVRVGVSPRILMRAGLVEGREDIAHDLLQRQGVMVTSQEAGFALGLDTGPLRSPREIFVVHGTG